MDRFLTIMASMAILFLIPLYLGLVAKVVSFGWYRGKEKAGLHNKLHGKI